jgi:NTP pyrophosphatase (non-canonical NTP hydrolase)
MAEDLSINQIIAEVMRLAAEKGFGTKPEEVSVPEKIALIHSEISECYDAFRHNNLDGKDGFAEELADIIIRVAHLAGVYGVDLEEEIIKKSEYNKNRVWNWDKLNEKHI